MATSVRTVTKALAAEEDLLFGEGTASQTRAGTSYVVSKIRGFRPVNSLTELNALDFSKFPKALLVENGSYKLYQHNGAVYEQLVPVEKVTDISTAPTAITALATKTVIFSSASAHTVSAITNGSKGQELTLIATTANTTIANNASIVLKGGANYVIPANTGIKLVFTGTSWAEV